MANIQMRPDGRWRARYRDANGKEHARHFSRKIDATRWLDSVAAAQASGTYIDPKAGRVTLGEYAQTWLTRQAHLKPSTRSRYRAIVRCHIEPAFGATPLAQIEHSAVTAWINKLLDVGIAAPTVRHIHRVLHMILNSAIDDGRLPRNPASRVKLPHARSRDKRFLSHEQVAALADAAGEDQLIIRVLAYCGLRFGELAALRVRNVDPLRRRLQIEESATEVDGRMVFGPPKSHQCRSVPVPRSLITDLAAACAGKSPNELLFRAPEGGVLWLRNWRRRVFDPAVEGPGLGQLSPHELRHTAASLAVAAGANVKAVQRTLGHASAAMTLDVYSGLFDDDLDAVADRLDVAVQSARESARGLSADFLRTDDQLIKLQDRTETPTAQ
jgi:integrase